MDYIKLHKNITFAFLRELLEQYQIKLEEDQKWARIKFARKMEAGSDAGNDTDEAAD